MDTARTALCLDCRTALAPNESCDIHKRARVLDLADVPQRNRAVDAVWGPPHLRVRTVATAGGVGASGGALVEGCGGCGDLAGSLEGEVAIAFFVIAIAAFAAVILYFVIKRIVHWIRAYRARPRPVGSAWKPARPRRVLRGTVTAATGSTTPFSNTPCAAWSVAIEHDRATGGRTMLRDGETRGMTIALDDGRTIEIAAGRVRLEGEQHSEDVSTAYLSRIDPHYVASDDHAVLAFDRGREVRLAVGDTVEIIGGLEERFDAGAAATFRESAPTQLVVQGVPTLVRVG